QLDGKPLRIYKTNVALMGAFIPAGDHTLQLTFRPLLWTTSLVISAIALLAVLAAAVIVRLASGSSTSASPHRRIWRLSEPSGETQRKPGFPFDATQSPSGSAASNG